MVWSKRKTTRKTYRKKRAYKKRAYKKKLLAKKNPYTRPFDSKLENEYQNVTFTATHSVTTGASPTGSAFMYIYWAAATSGGQVVTTTAPNERFCWDNTVALERSLYIGQYQVKKLNYVKWRFIPGMIQQVPQGGGSNTVIPSTWPRTVMSHYPSANGTNGLLTQQTSEQYCAITPLKKFYAGGKGFSGKVNSAAYIAKQSSFEPWVNGTSTAIFTSDCGCTVLRFDYSNMASYTTLGTLNVDYNMTFKGRLLGAQ